MKLNILISGGTGFIGSRLCEVLSKHHQVFVLTRNANPVSSAINYITDLNQLPADIPIEAIINLAGEPIADKRWSPSQKETIIQSRLTITSQLVDYCKQSSNKPALFINGSAIGYYGISPSTKEVTESDTGDDSFSSELCKSWEETAQQIETLGIRLCILRIGIVLGREGGALKKMLLPFKLGLGGKIGQGNQWMPWIHREDLISIIVHCINDSSFKGAINCTAPIPVTNSEFASTLALTLHRRAIFPMPAFVVKLLMGQMGEELLLAGKKVVPAVLLNQGFEFKFTGLKHALADILDD